MRKNVNEHILHLLEEADSMPEKALAGDDDQRDRIHHRVGQAGHRHQSAFLCDVRSTGILLPLQLVLHPFRRFGHLLDTVLSAP